MRTPKTLYEKRGRRYVAVGKDDIITVWPVGDYLVRIRKQGASITSRRRKMKMDSARLEIAMDEAADAMVQALREASQEQPGRLNTPREQRAFDAWKKIMGKETMTLTVPSAQEVCERAVRCLRDRLKGKDRCPTGCLEVYAEKDSSPKV